jgi:hypothetical protein
MSPLIVINSLITHRRLSNRECARRIRQRKEVGPTFCPKINIFCCFGKKLNGKQPILLWADHVVIQSITKYRYFFLFKVLTTNETVTQELMNTMASKIMALQNENSRLMELLISTVNTWKKLSIQNCRLYNDFSSLNVRCK